MRITNSMVFNSSLNNIWRNARHLNNLVTQIETTQRIQRPSEDPMMANRALRYRTILSENEQFTSNNERGLAWMEVSEASFLNLLVGTPSNPSILQRTHNRLLQASQTGSNYIEDQRGMINEMRQFLYQMTRIEMNQSYMGRYVFAGFHTDQPPVLHQDRPNASYVIQQTFNRNDIETVITFYRSSPTELPAPREGVHILKLPFAGEGLTFPGTNIMPGATGVPPFGIVGPPPANLQFHIIEFETANEHDAYLPDAEYNGFPVIHFIRETGELVMHTDTKEIFQDGTTVTFQQDGLRAGDLNPRIYFPSWDISGYPGTPLTAQQHFDVGGVLAGNNRQNIELEVSVNSYVTVNSLARDIVTDKLFADMRRLIAFADSLVSSDPLAVREHFAATYSGYALDRAVSTFLSNEAQKFAGAMHDRIDNMLESIERHINQAQTQHTNLGSRMNRMDMIQIRLEEDDVAYTSLLSETIDTDISGTIVRKNGAEAAFQNALFAISRATQLSLADFINR